MRLSAAFERVGEIVGRLGRERNERSRIGGIRAVRFERFRHDARVVERRAKREIVAHRVRRRNVRIDEIIVVRRSVARNDVREDRPQRSGHVEPPRDAPRVARVDERREDRRIGGDVFVGGGNDLVEKAGIGRVLDAELDLVAAVFDVVDVVTKACFAATLPGDERDTPVRKRVVVPKRSGTVRPELRLIDLQPFQRMRPRVHPLGFEHVVRAANARRRARLRALVGDAGILRHGAVEKPVRFARKRRAVLIVICLSEERDERDVVGGVGLEMDVARERELALRLQTHAVRARLGRIERVPVSVCQVLAPGRSRQRVTPAQVGRRPETAKRGELVERMSADRRLDGRASGIRSHRRNLIDDAAERILALGSEAGQGRRRAADAGREELRAGDVASGLGDQSLRNRNRVVIEYGVVDLSAAHNDVCEAVLVDAGNAGYRALHRALRVVRKPGSRLGRDARASLVAGDGEGVAGRTDRERSRRGTDGRDRFERGEKREGDILRAARKHRDAIAARALVSRRDDGNRVRIGDQAEQREPAARVGGRAVETGRRRRDDLRVADRRAGLVRRRTDDRSGRGFGGARPCRNSEGSRAERGKRDARNSGKNGSLQAAAVGEPRSLGEGLHGVQSAEWRSAQLMRATREQELPDNDARSARRAANRLNSATPRTFENADDRVRERDSGCLREPQAACDHPVHEHREPRARKERRGGVRDEHGVRIEGTEAAQSRLVRFHEDDDQHRRD